MLAPDYNVSLLVLLSLCVHLRPSAESRLVLNLSTTSLPELPESAEDRGTQIKDQSDLRSARVGQIWEISQTASSGRAVWGLTSGLFPDRHICFFMFFLADRKAASGVALPLVPISSAAFIELQNLPI